MERRENLIRYLILLPIPSVLKMDTRLKLASRDYNRFFENVMKYVRKRRACQRVTKFTRFYNRRVTSPVVWLFFLRISGYG